MSAPPLPPLALSRFGVAPFWEIIFRPSSRCTLHSEITAAAVSAVANPDQTGPIRVLWQHPHSLDGQMEGARRGQRGDVSGSPW